MLRDVLGAITGIAVALLTVKLFEWISHMVYPVPTDIDLTSTAAMADHMASAPPGALILVVAGYIVATFDGTFIAAWIGRAKPFTFALVVGVLILAKTVATLIRIPHPMWFNIAAVAGIIVAAWAATVAVPSTVRSGAPGR